LQTKVSPHAFSGKNVFNACSLERQYHRPRSSLSRVVVNVRKLMIDWQRV
jgi:hypothetical protein